MINSYRLSFIFKKKGVDQTPPCLFMKATAVQLSIPVINVAKY